MQTMWMPLSLYSTTRCIPRGIIQSDKYELRLPCEIASSIEENATNLTRAIQAAVIISDETLWSFYYFLDYFHLAAKYERIIHLNLP